MPQVCWGSVTVSDEGFGVVFAASKRRVPYGIHGADGSRAESMVTTPTSELAKGASPNPADSGPLHSSQIANRSSGLAAEFGVRAALLAQHSHLREAVIH